MVDILAFLESTIALAEGQDAPAVFKRKLVDAAVRAGFARARLWTYASDVLAQSERLVLVAHAHADPSSPPAYTVGIDLELRLAHFKERHSYEQPSFEPVVVDYSNPEGEDQEIARLLDLSGLVIEVPVFSAGLLDGILALELPPAATIPRVDLRLLQGLGFIVGQRLALDLSQAEDTLLDLPPDERRATLPLLRATLEHIAGEVSAAIVAAFEWNPETNLITKIDEVFHPSLQPTHNGRAMELDEQYAPGEYLTGKAWLSQQSRWIYSFKGLGDLAPEDIALPSLRWHEGCIGVVRSALYDVVVPREGTRTGSQFLFRLLNHVPDAKVPFVASDATLLRRICNRASQLFEDVNTVNRLGEVIRLSSLAVHDLRTFLDEFPAALAVEGLSGAVLVGRTDGTEADKFDFLKTIGSVRLDPSLRQITAHAGDELLATQVAGNSCRWKELGRSRLEELLRKAGYQSFLPIAFATKAVSGLVLVPSRATITSRADETLEPTSGSQRYLAACAELLGRSLEIRRSEQLATGALQALGYLGHEMGTPMTQLGSLAVKATSGAYDLAMKVLRQRSMVLRRAREVGMQLPADEIRELAPTIAEIQSIEDELVHRSDFLASLLSLAPIFAMRSNRSVRVKYQSISTSSLVKAAIDRTNEDPLLQPGARDSIVDHPWEIVVSGSVASGTLVTCDEYFASVAVASLLRNAVKYSVPRPGHGRSTVELNLQAQKDWLDVIVTNYGVGIAHEERQAIFEPFTQGSNYESVRAVRGMGLGLYLCRVLAIAHRGEVVLISSDPTDYADPERVSRLEGFKTVFRLRLSNRLSTGVHEVAIDGQR